MDLFGWPLPSFNMGGRREARTHAGGFISLIIFFFTLIYGLDKIGDLILRQNPQVTQYVEEEAYSIDDSFNMKDKSFMMAFSL